MAKSICDNYKQLFVRWKTDQYQNKYFNESSTPTFRWYILFLVREEPLEVLKSGGKCEICENKNNCEVMCPLKRGN